MMWTTWLNRTKHIRAIIQKLFPDQFSSSSFRCYGSLGSCNYLGMIFYVVIKRAVQLYLKPEDFQV
jgi:hypothetical protein